MNLPQPQEEVTVESALSSVTRTFGRSLSLKRFCLFVGCLILLFIQPLYDLVRFALGNDLYSYTLLIPCISFYLFWTNRKNLKFGPTGDFSKALVPVSFGLILLGGYFFAVRSGWRPSEVDHLAVIILAFILFFIGGCFAFLGTRLVRGITFPLALLFFFAPFPEIVRNAIETFLQHASAEVAYGMLKIAGMPVFREGLVFTLPGFAMRVAPECSGIRSSLVLLITSLIAANLFLKGTWSRVILVSSVVVLGVLRNGFRIFALGELCVHISPNIIDSPLHHRGGPIFFALSLIPLFFLLFFLRKKEFRSAKTNSINPP